MTAKKKGRCWKGCKPVPGKRAYSKGSCSCGMSAIAPVIELMRGDYAIPALKKALSKGIGNAGQPVSIHEIGAAGTTIPALRKKPKNVQRALTKHWGDKHDLAESAAYMKGTRDWAAKAIREDRSKRSMLSALTPGMIEFVDPRPRNDMGQYIGNETMGVDPNSMAAAYGNVEQEKMMRRRSLVQRMKAMMGRPQEQPMM